MTSRGTPTDDLLAYVFDHRPHALQGGMAEWMGASRRFSAFVATYRDKIRKKLRGAHEREAVRDIGAELEAAYLLLQEWRFDVEYEKYGVGKARCPDFTATFRANTLFNVEVTRMRVSPGAGRGDAEDTAMVRQREAARLAELVCAKLGQLQPGMINLLWVVMDGAVASGVDVAEVMKSLKARAEAKDAQLFARHDFRDTADFFKAYLRLSGLVIRESEGDGVPRPATLWVNHQAQPPLSSALRTALDNLG